MPARWENSAVELCTKIPSLTLIDLAQLHHRSPVTVAPADGTDVPTLSQFLRAL
ncbi:hypothetical protein LSCM1_00206 [Leishmania martiniquensis]|uniref:Uncharacterized protein n=1 Tax=Leishmania martiniquensis TaxID=1580590 RepID=A0A836GBI8_9TRYP|nr:hypothetical protein LSCM1_00206 [Leishmania martiniquensis]